jgi:hypothetical protein
MQLHHLPLSVLLVALTVSACATSQSLAPRPVIPPPPRAAPTTQQSVDELYADLAECPGLPASVYTTLEQHDRETDARIVQPTDEDFERLLEQRRDREILAKLPRLSETQLQYPLVATTDSAIFAILSPEGDFKYFLRRVPSTVGETFAFLDAGGEVVRIVIQVRHAGDKFTLSGNREGKGKTCKNGKCWTDEEEARCLAEVEALARKNLLDLARPRSDSEIVLEYLQSHPEEAAAGRARAQAQMRQIELDFLRDLRAQRERQEARQEARKALRQIGGAIEDTNRSLRGIESELDEIKTQLRRSGNW